MSNHKLTSLIWDDENVQLLKKLLDKGLTDKEIAIRMGASVSAIQGKRVRLGVFIKPHLRKSFDWTDERHDELRKMVDMKMSNEDIAERFGVSRNAIIGKKSRLGLSEASRRVSRRKAPPKPAEIQQSAPRGSERPTKPVSVSGGCFHPEHPESSPMASPGHHRFCRYPFGSSKTGDLTWCGEPAQVGSSYCEEHHILCHAPAKKNIAASAGIRRWR